MTSIYDDISYIETLNDMNTNQDINDNEERNVKIIVDVNEYEDSEDNITVFDLMYRRNMFEKLLNETLDELNQTNPCLEPGKYHMLCLYSNRYNKFIDIIKYKILTYELKRLSRKKINNWIGHGIGDGIGNL